MICVEVLVNGEPVCTSDGYLTFVNLVVHAGEFSMHPNHLLVSGFVDKTADPELAPRLRAALRKRPEGMHTSLDRIVAAGDEITIRIVDRPEAVSGWYALTEGREEGRGGRL